MICCRLEFVTRASTQQVFAYLHDHGNRKEVRCCRTLCVTARASRIECKLTALVSTHTQRAHVPAASNDFSGTCWYVAPWRVCTVAMFPYPCPHVVCAHAGLQFKGGEVRATINDHNDISWLALGDRDFALLRSWRTDECTHVLASHSVIHDAVPAVEGVCWRCGITQGCRIAQPPACAHPLPPCACPGSIR